MWGWGEVAGRFHLKDFHLKVGEKGGIQEGEVIFSTCN